MPTKKQIWIAGLKTAAAHSFYVSVAALTIAPAVFSFSKAGFEKLAGLLLFPVLHAVMERMADSPFPPEEDEPVESASSSAPALVALLFLIAILAPVSSHAQSVQNFYAGGASYNPGASPAVAFTGTYGHRIVDTSANKGLFAYTMVDVLPSTKQPYTVTTSTTVGVAQTVASIAGMDVVVPTGAGPAFTGSNLGWSWYTGAALIIPIKSKPGFYAMPTARMVKSSVSGGTGYQVIAGLQIGWGK